MEEKLDIVIIDNRRYIAYVDADGNPVKGDGPNGLKLAQGSDEKGYPTKGSAETALKEAGGAQEIGSGYYDVDNPPSSLDDKMIAYHSGQIDRATLEQWLGGKGPTITALNTWRASDAAYKSIQQIIQETNPSADILNNIPPIQLDKPSEANDITVEQIGGQWVLYDNVRNEVVSKGYSDQAGARSALDTGRYKNDLTAFNIHQGIVGSINSVSKAMETIRGAQDVFGENLDVSVLIKNFKDKVPGYTLDKLYKTLLVRGYKPQEAIDYLISQKVVSPDSSWNPPEVEGKDTPVVPSTAASTEPGAVPTAGMATSANIQSNINPVTGQAYPSPVQQEMMPAIAGTSAEGTMVPKGTLTPVQRSISGTEEWVPKGTLTPLTDTATLYADQNILAQFDVNTSPPATGNGGKPGLAMQMFNLKYPFLDSSIGKPGYLSKEQMAQVDTAWTQNQATPITPPTAGSAGLASIGQLNSTAGYDQQVVATLYDAAQKAGFTGDALHRAVATALAESSGNFGAENRSALGVPENSMGVWQINLDAHSDKVPGATFEDKVQWLKDPYNAAKIAYQVSSGGSDFSPWSVWHDKYGKPAEAVYTQLGNNTTQLSSPKPEDVAGTAQQPGLNLVPYTEEDATVTAAAEFDKNNAAATAAFDAYVASLGTRVFRTTPTSGFYYDEKGREVPISYVPERGRVEAGQPGAPSQAARSRVWEADAQAAGQYPLTPEQTAAIASLSIAEQGAAIQQMLGLDYMPGPTEVNAILGTSTAWTDQYPFMSVDERVAAAGGPGAEIGGVSAMTARENFQKAAEEAYPGDPIRQRQFVETNLASRNIMGEAQDYIAGYGYIGGQVGDAGRTLLESGAGTFGFNPETGAITKTSGVGGTDPETGQPMTETVDMTGGEVYLASLEANANNDPNAVSVMPEMWSSKLSSAAAALRAKDSASASRILSGIGRIPSIAKYLDELGIFGDLRAQLMALYSSAQQPKRTNQRFAGNRQPSVRINSGGGSSRPNRPNYPDNNNGGGQPAPEVPPYTPPATANPYGPFTTQPIFFAEGGTMQVSSPTAMVDMASNQTIGVAGEAGPESINVTPNGIAGSVGQMAPQQPMAQPKVQPKTLPQQGLGGIKASPSMKGILSTVAEQYRMRLQLVGTSPLLAQELARQRMQTPAGQARLVRETSQPMM